MMVVKVFSLALTVIVAILALRHMQAVLARLMASRVRAKVRPDRARRSATRLRQDPRTGVYYPEG